LSLLTTRLDLALEPGQAPNLLLDRQARSEDACKGIGVTNLKKRAPSTASLVHDRVLLALVVALIPIFYLVLYFGNHNKGLLAVLAIFVAIISYLVLCGYVAIIALIRIFRLSFFKSIPLLVCIALLILTPFGGPKAEYLIDQFRFYSVKSDYLALAQKNPSARFQAFDWGSSGFAGQSNFYYLVFDETGETLDGPIMNSKSASNRLLPGSSCSGSITHLSGPFFSVSIVC
jgi:hypothetical protein